MVNLKREEEGEMSIEEILASIRRYVGEEPQNSTEHSSLNSKSEPFSYIPSRGEADKTAEALAASLTTNHEGGQDNSYSASSYQYSAPNSAVHSKEIPPAENVIRLTEAYAAKLEPSPVQLDEKAILSAQAQSATTQSFARLAEAAMKPQSPSAKSTQTGLTLDQLIGEIAQPLIKQWLDQNLPRLVELTVTKEIERLAKQFSRE